MPKSVEEYLKDVSAEEREDLLKRFNISGGGSKTDDITAVGGRLGYRQPIDDSSDVEIGVSGHYAKGKNFKDKAIDRIDAAYRKKFDNKSELRAKLGAGKRGVDEVGVEYEIPFKKGGKVKDKSMSKPKTTKTTKTSKASSRGDGIAQRGKTKGRII